MYGIHTYHTIHAHYLPTFDYLASTMTCKPRLGFLVRTKVDTHTPLVLFLFFDPHNLPAHLLSVHPLPGQSSVQSSRRCGLGHQPHHDCQ